MMDVQLEKNANALEEQANEPKGEVKSDLFMKYTEGIKVATVLTFDAARKFKQHQIDYNPEGPFQQFTYQIVRAFNMHQILKISISLGYFSFSAVALNVNLPNPFANANTVVSDSSGKYGTVYFLKSDGKQIAVKSFAYNYQNFHIVFGALLQQWSILRICSILECAPQVYNQFGFDLIVYGDCIQIEMERGIALPKMSKEWYEDLKEGLSLMHSFHIIHRDIKPNNILFSPQLNKVVFIDFGFSFIIKESVGFKKKVSFRGSPTYCSEEMLRIFSQQAQYIDLYYNDLHGLMVSNLQLMQNKFFSIQNEEKSDPSQQKLFEKLKFEAEMSQTYFRYRFKYYYVEENILSVRKMLRNKERVSQQIKCLLVFMRRIFHSVFIPEIFEQLSEYKYLEQYNSIENLLKVQKSRIRVHLIGDSRTQDEEQSSLFQDKYKQCLLKSNKVPEIHSSISFDVYYEFLMKASFNPQNQEKYFDILLRCLLFNIRNLQCKLKMSIAAKWRKILQKQIPKPKDINATAASEEDVSEESIEQGSMDDIRDVFESLLHYCLQLPFSRWKRDNIFEVFYHCIIFKVDCFQLFEEFLKEFKDRYQTEVDIIILQLNLKSIESKIRHLVFSNQSHQLFFNKIIDSSLTDIRKYSEQFNKQIQNREEQKYYDQDKLIIQVKKRLDPSEDNLRRKNLEQLLLIIKRIKNKNAKNELLNIVIANLITSYFSLFDKDFLTIIRYFFNLIQQTQNSNIHLYFKFSNYIQGLKQFKKIMDEIKLIINCDFIYDKFIFQRHKYLRDLHRFDNKLTAEYLGLLDRKQSINQNDYNQLIYLLQKIKNVNQFEDNFKDLLIRLYAKTKIIPVKTKFIDCQQFHRNFVIQSIYVKLLPDSITFEKQIALLEYQTQHFSTKWEEIKYEDVQVKKLYAFNFYKQFLQMILLKYMNCKKYKRTHESLMHLLELTRILRQWHFNQFHPYFFNMFCNQIIKLSFQLQEMDIFSQFIDILYTIALKEKSGIIYFYSNTNNKKMKNLILSSLIFFYFESHQQKIVSLLKTMNEWISENPIEEYIPYYIQAVRLFYLRVTPSFFQFRSLRRKFNEKQNRNPYIAILYICSAQFEKKQADKIKILKFIATYIPQVTRFTKSHLLKKYHQILIKITILNKRQILCYFFRINKIVFQQKKRFAFLIKKLQYNFKQVPFKRAFIAKHINRLLI